MKKLLEWLVIVAVITSAFCWYKGIGPFSKAPVQSTETPKTQEVQPHPAQMNKDGIVIPQIKM